MIYISLIAEMENDRSSPPTIEADRHYYTHTHSEPPLNNLELVYTYDESSRLASETDKTSGTMESHINVAMSVVITSQYRYVFTTVGFLCFITYSLW